MLLGRNCRCNAFLRMEMIHNRLVGSGVASSGVFGIWLHSCWWAWSHFILRAVSFGGHDFAPETVHVPHLGNGKSFVDVEGLDLHMHMCCRQLLALGGAAQGLLVSSRCLLGRLLLLMAVLQFLTAKLHDLDLLSVDDWLRHLLEQDEVIFISLRWCATKGIFKIKEYFGRVFGVIKSETIFVYYFVWRRALWLAQMRQICGDKFVRELYVEGFLRAARDCLLVGLIIPCILAALWTWYSLALLLIHFSCVALNSVMKKNKLERNIFYNCLLN